MQFSLNQQHPKLSDIHLLTFGIFGLPKKIPKTLISFRMPIISQHLTMAPPLCSSQPEAAQQKRIVSSSIYLAPLLPGPHACWPCRWSEAICMIYPNNIGSHWKHLKLECHPVQLFTQTRVFSCHLYLTWAPDDPATLPPRVLVLGKPYMWAPQPPPASPGVQQACLIQTSSKTSRWRVLAGIWRIITVSKWLITMVIKSPK